MTQKNSLVKLWICEREDVMKFQILGEHQTGHKDVWGDCKTLQGAKKMITMHSKRFGLVKAADGMSATGVPTL